MAKRFNYKRAMEEHLAGRELVGIVQRLGGGRTEYKKMYDWIFYGVKP